LPDLAEPKADRYVCIEVPDRGRGMDESVQKRIFEPFFTTKQIGRGTGLGPALVYGIIKNHHAFIQVKSKPTGGATFQLYLPAASAGE
jgi:signal transduction histidine kinase